MSKALISNWVHLPRTEITGAEVEILRRHSMQAGVYAIQNLINGKMYVGSAYRLGKRWSNHLYSLRKGNHRSQKLQNAWNKYGQDCFVYRILLVCSKVYTLEYEQIFLDHFQCVDFGYNNAPVAGNCAGTVHTEQSKANMLAGRKTFERSPETRAKISAAMRGRKLSEEHKRKISLSGKGKLKPRKVSRD